MKNSSVRCYKSKQRKATKKTHEKWLNLSEDEKEKSGNMVVNDMKNLPENETQRLVECRKNYLKCKKGPGNNF